MGVDVGEIVRQNLFVPHTVTVDLDGMMAGFRK
jgi:hypothetical protein